MPFMQAVKSPENHHSYHRERTHGVGIAKSISTAPRRPRFFLKLTISPIFVIGSLISQYLCITKVTATKKIERRSTESSIYIPKNTPRPPKVIIKPVKSRSEEHT